MATSEGSETPIPDASDVEAGRLFNELFDRAARGEILHEDELRDEFPEHASELRDHLQLVDQLRQPRDTIGRLVRGGLFREPTDESGLFTFGKYQIHEVVGEGGMGIVLRARDPDLDREVAIKILRPEIAPDQRARRRFLREAKAAARLDHPNVVAVQHVGDQDGTAFMVMEYVRGPSLAALIREQGALDRERARSYFRQILSGLGAAHDAGLIHRDLKPSNILIEDATKSAKLADFGLARIIDSQSQLTLPHAVFGTPQYMSPEQACGDARIDHRSDLYSAGVVLYEMLTGRPPFRAETPSALLHQIIHADPPPLRGLAPPADERLVAIALQLMAKKPEYRFGSVSSTLNALDSDRPLRRRRWRPDLTRWRIAGLIGLGTLVGLTTWALSGMARGRAIAEVKILEDGRGRTGTIAVRHENDLAWSSFKSLPAEAGALHAVWPVDLLGHGRRWVLAAPSLPFEGKNIIAFDERANERWSMDLSSARNWPDSGLAVEWICRALKTAELDGKPGDEIVVAANEFGNYAGRVSTIDPRRRQVLQTFWHLGNIDGISVIRDFFGAGQSAILVHGSNNKLDGFRDVSADGGRSWTVYDVVSFVAILDPRNMEGLGPPLTNLIPDLAPLQPYAYAFLDAAVEESHDARSTGSPSGRRPLRPEEVASITGASEAAYAETPNDGPWIWIDARWLAGEPSVTLAVDRNLNLRTARRRLNDPNADAFWQTRWRPIIRDGEYIGSPFPADHSER